MATLPELWDAAEHTDRMLYDWEMRRRYVKHRSWFILTAETALTLAYYLADKSVIEVGAGNGFLAGWMRELGVRSYKAYDFFRSGYFSRKDTNYGVMNRNAFRVRIKGPDVIVMCWPLLNAPFARRIAAKMVSGQILIYQGEWNGCTGDRRYHEMLEDQFEELEDITQSLNKHHVQWFGLHDDWYVLRKK